VFTGEPHQVGAQALTDTVLIRVAKERVLAEVGSNARLALRMLANVSCRLDELMRDVEASALHSGLQRVIGFLLRQQSRPGGHTPNTVSLPVSKATIASMLSLTPEYLSRMLRTLESAELIKMDRRDIRILDSRRLASYQPPRAARSRLAA
jgi:CRP-like cAMP-binding protein